MGGDHNIHRNKFSLWYLVSELEWMREYGEGKEYVDMILPNYYEGRLNVGVSKVCASTNGVIETQNGLYCS